jgi:hypothetical protein
MQAINTKETHLQAMNFAQDALVFTIKGDTQKANALYEKAFDLEKQAALSLLDKENVEPTRSILFRSAAALAKKCQKFREAEKMIAFGLSGNPPEEIALELREIYNDIIKKNIPKKKSKNLKSNVVLLVNIPQAGLVVGDVGTILHIFNDTHLIEVAFNTLNGQRIATEMLPPDFIRIASTHEVAHSRVIVNH